ncbi:MAG: SirB2 family protein [Lonepinella koalarum]|nr:SirB2 family protein [Lonepinella koalarum]
MSSLVTLHIISAFLSLFLLLIRGSMQFGGKNWRAIKLLKILPHLSDTLLIVTGISLIVMLKIRFPMWLLAKIGLLIFYIIFSAKFFSRKAIEKKNIHLIFASSALIGAILIGYLN